MIQHILLGDLAPLCLRRRADRAAAAAGARAAGGERLRFLAHPVVALPDLGGEPPRSGTCRSPTRRALHHSRSTRSSTALLHLRRADVGAGARDAARRRSGSAPGRSSATSSPSGSSRRSLGNVFVWSGDVFYGVYAHPVERWGISPAADQGIAGGVMMIEGSLVTLGALAWLFLRWAQESEVRQQLLEQGLDARAATRAVRYGRGEELSEPALRSWCQECAPPASTTSTSSSARSCGACPSTASCSSRSAGTGSARSRASAARRSGTSRARQRARAARGADASRGRTTATGSASTTSPSRPPRARRRRARRLARADAAPRSRAAPEEYAYMPGYYAVFFYDPDGIKLEIVHVPGHAA